jgi:hypothetical protein
MGVLVMRKLLPVFALFAALTGLPARAADERPLVDQIPEPPAQTGSVTFRTGAGQAEARIQATGAILKAADMVADRVLSATSSRTVLIVPATMEISLPHYRLYELRRTLLTKGLVQAGEFCPPDMTKSVTGVVEAADALAVFAKLGSYFQSRYELGGLDVAVDEELTAAAVGGALRRRNVAVSLPAPWASDAVITATEEELGQLERLGDAALGCQEYLKRRIRTANDAETMAALEAKAAIVKVTLDGLDGFLSALAAPADKSMIALGPVLVERQLALDMKGKVVLRLETHAVDSSFYSVTNLWTFLGTMPVYVSGVAVLSFKVLDEDSRTIRDIGVIMGKSGFDKVHRINRP